MLLAPPLVIVPLPLPRLSIVGLSPFRSNGCAGHNGHAAAKGALIVHHDRSAEDDRVAAIVCLRGSAFRLRNFACRGSRHCR